MITVGHQFPTTWVPKQPAMHTNHETTSVPFGHASEELVQLRAGDGELDTGFLFFKKNKFRP